MTNRTAISFSTPNSVAAPFGNYSHLVTIPANHRLLVLAGQTGHAPDGSLPDDFQGQFSNAMRNVLAILAAEGAGPEAIVKLNTWVVAGTDRSDIQQERQDLLQGVRPATTFAYVAGLYLPELLVEVECWAAILE